ncbi:MAG: exodeoxyribonuclease VII small subunit [Clostridia bacterium]|nr:exodeoxyribonuclease VII small subunit [Clostridia bacterium]
MNNEMTFEQAMQRLEEIVNQLETGKCPLNESMTLFDEGTKLVAFCSDTLKTAEQKILQLTQTGIEE